MLLYLQKYTLSLCFFLSLLLTHNHRMFYQILRYDWYYVSVSGRGRVKVIFVFSLCSHPSKENYLCLYLLEYNAKKRGGSMVCSTPPPSPFIDFVNNDIEHGCSRIQAAGSVFEYGVRLPLPCFAEKDPLADDVFAQAPVVRHHRLLLPLAQQRLPACDTSRDQVVRSASVRAVQLLVKVRGELTGGGGDDEWGSGWGLGGVPGRALLAARSDRSPAALCMRVHNPTHHTAARSASVPD